MLRKENLYLNNNDLRLSRILPNDNKEFSAPLLSLTTVILGCFGDNGLALTSFTYLSVVCLFPFPVGRWSCVPRRVHLVVCF